MIDNKYSSEFDKKKVCVIMPTYNNCYTIEDVLNEVLTFTNNVIVVNDGSTDKTGELLNHFSGLEIIEFKKNLGKGASIRAGFKKAIELGYNYAITIDTDGQHSPQDLPLFLDSIDNEPDSIIIGARNMTQTGVPGKSSFGNKFSNFWFWVETGKRMPDTQSGFRLYPISLMKDIHFFTNRFEFEIESIVKSSWKGIEVTSIPISIYYPPKNIRVSHFRPVKDFARISILNTYLVILSLVYHLIIKFIRNLNKKNIREFLERQLFKKDESNFKKSISVGFGVFMGIIPIWGYQLALAIILAYVFKLNKLIVATAANISIPPMIPFILFGSYVIGAIVLGIDINSSLNAKIDFEFIGRNLYQYIIGSCVFAVILGILFGSVTFLILKIFSKRKNG